MKYNIFVLVLVLPLYDSDGASLRGLTTTRTCEPCSAEVCCDSQCDASHPYVCTKGTAIRGCNSGPTYWTETDVSCQECCDLKNCDPADECGGRNEPPERSCGTCSSEVCAKNECSDEHPYVCVEGTAIGGCNNGPTYWTETDENCSKCCDLKTCNGRIEPTCEKECSEEVCRDQTCSDINPFACTDGGTESDATIPTYGCNPDKDYWLQTDKNCKDCCDVRKCEIGKVEPTVTIQESTKPATTPSSTPCPEKTKKSRYAGHGTRHHRRI